MTGASYHRRQKPFYKNSPRFASKIFHELRREQDERKSPPSFFKGSPHFEAERLRIYYTVRLLRSPVPLRAAINQP